MKILDLSLKTFREKKISLWFVFRFIIVIYSAHAFSTGRGGGGGLF